MLIKDLVLHVRLTDFSSHFSSPIFLCAYIKCAEAEKREVEPHASC